MKKMISRRSFLAAAGVSAAALALTACGGSSRQHRSLPLPLPPLQALLAPLPLLPVIPSRLALWAP